MASSSTTTTTAKRSFDESDAALADAEPLAAVANDGGEDFEREIEFGITQFRDARASRVAFDGVLKHTCADFVVDEVDRDGSVVRLTDSSTLPPRPQLPVEALPSDDEWRAAGVSDDELARFRAFVAAADKTAAFEFSPALAVAKETRTALHKFVKRMQSPIVSRTANDPTRIVVAFVGADAALLGTDAADGGAYNRGHKQVRGESEQWPVREQRVLSFVLCKQNIDTQSAIGTISRMLRVPDGTLSVAGVKDKRAVTTQRVTGFKVLAERVAGLQPRLAGSMLFGNFRYVAENLQLGDHGANHFGIVVRELTVADDAVLVEACDALRELGFLNYFGLQRFGMAGVGTTTSDIGRFMLQRDYRGAVRALLGERPSDTPEMTAARRLFLEHNDIAGACAKLASNRALATEHAVLAALAKKPTDFLHALNTVPRSIRLMYLHAWQSHVFNAALSDRIQRFGRAPVVGDLVWADSAAQTVRVVTDADIAAGALSLSDVVLPVIGHSTVLPEHAVADVYRAALGVSKLDPDSFRGVFDLAGVYRAIVTRPINFTYRIARYSDITLPLIRTPFVPADAPLGDDANGTHRALVLDFTLPPSTYATMLFRELMRSGTSKETQRSKSLKLQ